MAFIDDVKAILGVDFIDSDAEINDLIEAAKIDLKIAGVNVSGAETGDPLIEQAIKLYCKANYKYEDPQMAERFDEVYTKLKERLGLSTEYAEVVVT